MKKKIDILSKIIDKETFSEINELPCYDYWDWYEDTDFYMDEDIDYIYELMEFNMEVRISKRNGISNFFFYNLGRYIKMDTIYNKQQKRKRKINKILGLGDYKPRIGDLIKDGRNL